MTEDFFEKMWEQECVAGQARRISEGYPLWRKKCKQRNSILITCAVAICITTTAIQGYHAQISSTHSTGAYTGGKLTVVCNHSDYSNSHWLNVANEMLALEIH